MPGTALAPAEGTGMPPAAPNCSGMWGWGKPWEGGMKPWESPSPCTAHEQHLPLASSLPQNRKEMKTPFFTLSLPFTAL